MDLSVEIAGIRLKNPVIAASGTFGYGPIDYVGMLEGYRTKLKETKLLLLQLQNVTDANDGNLTTIQNDLLTLT